MARELPDGSLELIDGHLRAETTPEMSVPVLVLDVNEAEANKILATHDPLGNLAGCDAAALESLVADVQTDNAALQKLLDDMLQTPAGSEPDEFPRSETSIPHLFQIVVECRDEAEQQSVYERLIEDGLKCRLMML